MKNYEPIARKYRPQTFQDVLGQKAVVQTITNALRLNKVSQAYLFCGTRGTGKTTLARIFAKALNCANRKIEEPCCQCSSCLEIASCRSLDVIEIDGASNRGIDDIRNITESSLYAPSSGKYKIYIIDEVHMLTKEAFNALLKTLEEPPASVKFFFATTEPHKLPPTIISRCQRFDLGRISSQLIEEKLSSITKEMNKSSQAAALALIAHYAAGSMRDAQSMLDQILCYEDEITCEKVRGALGLLEEPLFSMLDEAIEKEDLTFPFLFMEKIHSSGRDYSYAIDELITHFRNHLAHLIGFSTYYLTANYCKEQLLYLLDILFSFRQKISKSHINKEHLELLLLKMIRSKRRVPLEDIIDRLQMLKEYPPAAQPVEATPSLQKKEPVEILPKELTPSLVSLPFSINEKPSEKVEKSLCHLDTLLRFASVEWEGVLKMPSREDGTSLQ